MPTDNDDHAAAGRRLMRRRDHAALATLIDGRPYVSLVAAACDTDGSPLLLLSDLAQHTRNLAAEPSVSLLYDDTAGHTDPLAGSRLTVLGHASRCEETRALARFAARHPASARYAGFADFHLYRVTIERGHLVAGFGRIAWVEADQLPVAGDVAPLAAAEPEIVAHMNADHADAVALYAKRLLGLARTGWTMTGIDPDGIDLRRDNAAARLDFPTPVLTAAAARHALVALVDEARRSAAPAQRRVSGPPAS